MIANAIAVAITSDQGVPTLLSSGTFEKYQGIDRVMKAFATVQAELPDAHDYGCRYRGSGGKPLVATSIWSQTQVLDVDVFFLVEPTPECIAEGMLQVLNEPEAAAHRAIHARKLYEREYAPPSMSRRFAN